MKNFDKKDHIIHIINIYIRPKKWNFTDKI
jgi:hypothetical protein